MTIFFHELKQGKKATFITSLASCVLMLLIMSVQPKVQNQMKMVEKLVAGLGPLAQAFAMDKLDMGELLNYYSLEAGNTMLLIGCAFSCVMGISMLSKEEGRHTAEFLFPHPISRLSVILQKWLALIVQLLVFVIIYSIGAYTSFIMLKQPYDINLFLKIQLSLFILFVCVGSICFSISAFISHEATGVGVGIALTLYVMNLLINLDVGKDIFKYITPIYFTEPAKIVTKGAFDMYFAKYYGLITITSLLLGTLRYATKDLRI
ncbi:MAG: ABC transporter permease subunit [Christensenellaceae bacterium]|nr:ABC transporter permease subunit [Christensenellaceae bacterium]